MERERGNIAAIADRSATGIESARSPNQEHHTVELLACLHIDVKVCTYTDDIIDPHMML